MKNTQFKDVEKDSMVVLLHKVWRVVAVTPRNDKLMTILTLKPINPARNNGAVVSGELVKELIEVEPGDFHHVVEGNCIRCRTRRASVHELCPNAIRDFKNATA